MTDTEALKFYLQHRDNVRRLMDRLHYIWPAAVTMEVGKDADLYRRGQAAYKKTMKIMEQAQISPAPEPTQPKPVVKEDPQLRLF